MTDLARQIYPAVLLAVLALSLIRYDRTILAILALFLAANGRGLAEAVRRRPDVAATAAALFAWIAALSLWRGDRLALQFLVQYAGVFALFLAAGAMAAHGRAASEDHRLILGFLVAASLLLLVPATVLYGDFLKVFRPDEAFAGRWSLVFNNPNVYGIVMATGFCLAIALWQAGRLSAPVLAAAAALFLFQVAMSESRNAFGVAGLGALALAAIALGGRGAWLMRGLALLLAAAIGAGIAYLAATGRLTHANETQGFGTTLDVRLHAWRQTVGQIADHPWAGVGTGVLLTGQPHRHAHNVALTWAAEFGLVGLILALACLVACLRRARPAALVPLIPALAGQMIDDFHFQRSFALIVAALLAGVAFARTDRAPPAAA
ncbi:MAG: O-antigen ligase family protein [Alphaproteobacteria bacterium]|nr:O-antigen ligase family protein [Alphaproteobacteria bacterium]